MTGVSFWFLMSSRLLVVYIYLSIRVNTELHKYKGVDWDASTASWVIGGRHFHGEIHRAVSVPMET